METVKIRQSTFKFYQEENMNLEKEILKTPGQKTEKETGSGHNADQTIFKRGTEAFEHAEKAVSDAYEKTSEKAGETYEHVKSYSSDNPGKTVLIALGIGLGLGLLLSAGMHHSHSHHGSSRFARPVVNALSDIAMEFFG
jgi:ElaB/YqjD/DUF883 family membrane-anchored ribosome-binding protein